MQCPISISFENNEIRITGAFNDSNKVLLLKISIFFFFLISTFGVVLLLIYLKVPLFSLLNLMRRMSPAILLVFTRTGVRAGIRAVHPYTSFKEVLVPKKLISVKF